MNEDIRVQLEQAITRDASVRLTCRDGRDGRPRIFEGFPQAIVHGETGTRVEIAGSGAHRRRIVVPLRDVERVEFLRT